MKVVLLSAGMGTRLYPLTEDTPKCLLPIVGNKLVLDYQMDALLKAGIKDVVIVVGYKAEKIEKYIWYKGYNKKFNLSIVYNPFYDVSNNLVSLWFARYYMDDELITINGDDIFHWSIIKRLLDLDYPSITLTISRKDVYDLDDMKVIIEGNTLKRIGKDIPLEIADGESVGIIRYTREGARLLRDKLDSMVRDKSNLQLFFFQLYSL